MEEQDALIIHVLYAKFTFPYLVKYQLPMETKNLLVTHINLGVPTCY